MKKNNKDGGSRRRERRSNHPGELEDLQMTLSLADDAHEEFMEDVTLEEAEAYEVKEVTSVLQRLSSSCEEREFNFRL